MRLQENIDFTTLAWVRPELDTTFRQARQALEDYVEGGGGAARMRECAGCLHQVQGTLRMVELYGAAMVAEEMEQLARALPENGVADRDEAGALLMRGIVQLPDYLDRLQGGHRDIPIVLLPLLNELRAARGAQGVSEAVMFSPDLARELPANARGPAVPLPDAPLRVQVETLRTRFQAALLQWLKEDSRPANIDALTEVCEQLVRITRAEPARRLFWVAAGTLDALRAGAFEASRPLKQALGRVEREIKRLADGGDAAFRSDPPLELTRQLLYFVANAPTDHDRIDEIRDVFGLGQYQPDVVELEHARGSLSGRNRALLDTVSAALKEDLLRVKDALDMHLRTHEDAPGELEPQAEVLDRVADTLGMLGLGVPRRVVQDQRQILRAIAAGTREADESTLLDIAGALLYVEATLDDQVARLGRSNAPIDEGALSGAEAQRVLDALLHEALANFVKARHSFVAFVETGWDHQQLDEVPRLLDEVAGAMRILEIDAAAQYLTGARRFTEVELLGHRRVPNARQIDALADALASIEYFLEALGERRAGRERILDIARERLQTLGYWPLPDEASAPAPVGAASSLLKAAAIPGRSPRAAATSAEPEVPVAAEAAPTEAIVEADLSVEPAPDIAKPESAPVQPAASAQAPRGFEGGSEDIDDDIREVFLEEFAEEIANLENLLPTWRADPASPEVLRPIRRVFHTLKGSGRLVGALTLGEFSWKVENMLNRVLDGTRPASPAVQALVDHAFRALPSLHAALQGEGAIAADLEAIKAVADRLAAGEETWLETAAAHPPEAAPVEPPAAEPSPAPTFDLDAGGTPASIDAVLFEILKAEVAGHLQTIDAWLAGAGAASRAASDPLLRAVHTMNGAFAMTETPVITEVLGPLEAYIKRLMAADQPSTREGAALVGEAADAVRATLAALDSPRPHVPPLGDLPARAAALRDSLPPPAGPTLPLYIETEDEALPQPVELEAPDMSALPGDELDELAGAALVADPSAIEAALDAEPADAESAHEALPHADRVHGEPVVYEYIAVEPEAEIAPEPAAADEAASEQRGDDDALAQEIAALAAAAADEDLARVLADAAEREAVATLVPETVEAAADERTFDETIDETLAATIASYAGERAIEPAGSDSVTVTSTTAVDAHAEAAAAAADAGSADEAQLAGSANEAPADEVHLAEVTATADDEYYGLTLEELEALTAPDNVSVQASPAATAASDHDAHARTGAEVESAEAAATDARGEAPVGPSIEARSPAEDAALVGVADESDAAAPTEAQAVSEPGDAVESADAFDTEAVDAEALDSEAIEAGALDSEAIEAGAFDAEALDTEAIEAEAFDAGTFDAGTAPSAETQRGESATVDRETSIEPGPDVQAASAAELVSPDETTADVVAESEAPAFDPASAPDADARAGAAAQDETPAGVEADADRTVLVVYTDSDETASAIADADEVPAELEEPALADEEEEGFAAAARTAADAVDPDPDEPLDMRELDPELLDIFLEEARDLLDHSDGLMAKLHDHRGDRESVAGLQRDLHTLKGGARMAGIHAVGELGHVMESLLEAVAENRRELDGRGVVVLERGFDRLHGMVTRVGERRAIALPMQLIAQLEALARGEVPETAVGAASAATGTPVQAGIAAPRGERPWMAAALRSEEAAPTAAPASRTLFEPLSAPLPTVDEDDDIGVRAPAEQVRIRADLLDRLVNYAGEVAIYRARLEQQLGAFRGNLGELGQTTARLREQLRRLEMETEAQIASRYRREHDETDSTFDPLELDRFSTQQQLTRGLAESAADLVSLQGALDELTRQYETLLLQQSRVSSDLQEGLMRTRMVPFDSLVPRLRRVLRQAAGETGRQVQIRVDGAQGEMDRSVLERMTAPLEHMLRNAVAHGIETPAERRKAGKPEEGTVRIAVAREGSEVVLTVGDDGCGLDRDAIQRKAIERGLLKPGVPVADVDLDAFILETGFSTADAVSRLAGRGVGMDVVHSEIRQLGGSLAIESAPGKGCTFTVRLPFTLAVTQAVFVKIGETGFAVPIASVQGVGRIARDELAQQLAGGKAVYRYAGEDYAVHDLGHLLGHGRARAEDSLQMPLLLIRSGDLRAAVCIDQVLGSREIVVKPVGPQINSIPGIFGATIMGDGSVVVILDVAPLVRRHAAHAPAGAASAATTPPAEPEVRRVPLVMVVDDSITMRKITGRVLERHNFEVMTAKDGIDALEKLTERVPDLMLLDIEMPRMDGYELATRMKNDARLKSIPIVMITSRTGDKHRQRAFEIGVERYLGKPYQETELMHHVFELLTAERADA